MTSLNTRSSMCIGRNIVCRIYVYCSDGELKKTKPTSRVAARERLSRRMGACIVICSLMCLRAILLTMNRKNITLTVGSFGTGYIEIGY